MEKHESINKPENSFLRNNLKSNKFIKPLQEVQGDFFFGLHGTFVVIICKIIEKLSKILKPLGFFRTYVVSKHPNFHSLWEKSIFIRKRKPFYWLICTNQQFLAATVLKQNFKNNELVHQWKQSKKTDYYICEVFFGYLDICVCGWINVR